jgi:hypothetical protein
VKILRVLSCMYVIAALVGCDAEQAERARAEKARHETELKHQCEVLTEIIALARERGRSDLFDPDISWSCETLADSDDCGLKVELLVELASAGRSPLATQLEAVGRDCAGEHRFALKYGMEAFRDHRKLVKEAEDYVAAEAAVDAMPPERDPPERGP